MPSYQFLAVARIQFRQRDIVYFGKQDIGGFSFLHDCQRQDYWPFFAIFNVRYWSLMLSAFRHFIITDWRGV
ncbi:hypothetical protein N7234_24955, partial [Escherichia coli]|nr:hypothetical protein [Escherichia coli]